MPELGEVYDYKLDDAGISQPLQEEDEEEENKTKKVRFQLSLYGIVFHPMQSSSIKP